MKKIILSAIILISFFSFPLFSQASYIIHLKDGGQFITAQYWEENGQIHFFVSGGTMGIDKAEVRKIEKSNLDPDENNEIDEPRNDIPPVVVSTPEKKIKKDAIPPESAEKKEKVDLKVYQDKMATLNTEAKKALVRLREAIKNKDTDAKAAAAADRHNISVEIRKLTDELKQKNNGELPADWYDRVNDY